MLDFQKLKFNSQVLNKHIKVLDQNVTAFNSTKVRKSSEEYSTNEKYNS